MLNQLQRQGYVPRILHPAAVFVLTLAAYMLTMPRAITLEDAGLFQMVCHLGGISHPPGYPLFTLLCNAMVQSPDVVNGNLVSAIFGALAAAMLHEVAWTIKEDRAFAYVASLGWGFSATFWSQSIIIEVYTLAALLFVVCWWLTLLFVKTRKTTHWLILCFVYGLSLSDHWPLMILSTMGLVAAAWPALGEVVSRCKSPGFVAVSFLCLALGLVPYVSLFINTDPQIAVFGGIHSMEEFARYVSRAAYNDNNPAAGVMDKLMYAGWLLEQSGTQLGLVGAPIIVLGLVASFRLLARSIAAALLLTFLGSTFVLLMLLNFEFTPFFRAVFKPYPIIAYSSVAMWFALGTNVLVTVARRFTKYGRPMIVAAAIIAVLLSNYPQMNRSHSVMVDNYMRTVLGSLPKDAVLFVQGDNETGPMGYLHYVEGIRPDLEVRDWDNLVFSNRLSSPFLDEEDQQRVIEAFINHSTRPVFTMNDNISPRVDYGAYFRFDPSGNGYRFLPQLGSLVDLLVKVYRGNLMSDLHEEHFVFERLIQFSRQYVGYGIEHSRGDLPQAISARLEALQQTFPGKLVMLEKLVALGADACQKEVLLALAGQAEQQVPDYATPESLAVFYELYGRIHLFAPADLDSAARYFVRSIDAYPVRGNSSICRLRRVYEREGNKARVRMLDSRYPGLDCKP